MNIEHFKSSLKCSDIVNMKDAVEEAKQSSKTIDPLSRMEHQKNHKSTFKNACEDPRSIFAKHTKEITLRFKEISKLREKVLVKLSRYVRKMKDELTQQNQRKPQES